MSYNDFLANFDEIQLCHLQPDAVGQDLAKATVYTLYFLASYNLMFVMVNFWIYFAL